MKNPALIKEIKKLFSDHKSGSTNKVGRPEKPAIESIVKAYKVRTELLNTSKNVDDVCKEFNIAKSTYYRVSKWLSVNTKNYINEQKP